MVAAAIIGSAVVGGAATAITSSNASRAQQNAANTAAQTAERQQALTRADLLPYQDFGRQSLDELAEAARVSSPNALIPFAPTQATLEKTPGYQFTLQQGLKGVQNAAAARGLGVSGAALKGAASYATGLANSTWADQLNTYLTQQNQQWNQQTQGQQNRYNRLLGIAQVGENAAAQTGAYGTQTASNVANAQIASGNAAAAGALGVGNSINNAAGNIGNYLLLGQFLKGGGGAGAF